MDKKSYGLLIPKKAKTFQPKAKSIFDSDSDENESSTRLGKKPPQKLFKVEAKHVKEDPNIYEYDSIYDSMKETQTLKEKPSEIKKPRYINSLLKAADKRKKDQERRVEKKIHHERVKEGDEFKDKEAFVTSAYKKKMQEMEEEEEKEKMKEKLDEMMDVRKQKDLSGFYRHLLNQTTGEEKVPEFGDTDKLTLKDQDLKALAVTVKSEKISSHDDDSDFSDSEQHKKSSSKNNQSSTVNKDRQLELIHSSKQTKKNSSRRRHDSESESSAGDEDTNIYSKSKDKIVVAEHCSPIDKLMKRKNPSNDESDIPLVKSMKHSEEISSLVKEEINSAENSDVDEPEPNKPEGSMNDNKTLTQTANENNSDVDANIDADDDIVDSDSEKSDNDIEKEPKSDGTTQQSMMSAKFVKRTVGEVFMQAQERYFRRMAAKNESKNP